MNPVQGRFWRSRHLGTVEGCLRDQRHGQLPHWSATELLQDALDARVDETALCAEQRRTFLVNGALKFPRLLAELFESANFL
jgi:hypothetical protein